MYACVCVCVCVSVAWLKAVSAQAVERWYLWEVRDPLLADGMARYTVGSCLGGLRWFVIRLAVGADVAVGNFGGNERMTGNGLVNATISVMITATAVQTSTASVTETLEEVVMSTIVS